MRAGRSIIVVPVVEVGNTVTVGTLFSLIAISGSIAARRESSTVSMWAGSFIVVVPVI
jgi:hypothetical protein